MAETIVLDPTISGLTQNRTSLDITNWVAASGDGVNWGDAEIQAYVADQMVGSSPVDYRLPNRIISIPLILQDMGSTSFATINTQLQQKVALLQREGGWIQRTVGGTNLYADVVNATLHLGGDWVQAFHNADVNATLQLECIPDWYGDEVTLDTLTGTAAITSVLTSSGGTATIAGDHPGRVRLLVSDTSGNDQHGLLWGLRSQHYSGSTTAALSYEAEAMTAVNGATAAALSGASGGTAVVGTTFPAATWVSMLYSNLTAGSAPLTHVGSYRTWARCYSTATPQFQLQWGVGALSVPVTNDPVRLPGTAAFYMLDLGTVRIDPPPVGTTQWFAAVQAQVDTANDQVAIDRIFFQPIDESSGKLQYVATTPASSVTATAYAGTAANDAGVGSINWTNPANVTAKDGTYASLSGGGGFSHWLKTSSHGFAIPSGSTIKGIVVTITRENATGSGTCQDGGVRLVKAGTVQTTDRSSGTSWGLWTDATYGSPTDLWGTTWSVSDVNNSGFGAALETLFTSTASPRVDAISITVYYTLASGFTIAPDAVIYGSATAELRTDGMYRAGTAGGTVYAPVSSVTGDLPRIPPSGLETRPVQVFLKPTRGDLDQLADSGLDNLSVSVKARPSYLFRP